MKQWIVTAFVLSSLFGALVAYPDKHNNQGNSKSATLNSTKWRQVPLSFRPFDITAHGGDLFACGSDETVAVSKDNGVTWKVVHQKQDGEILLKIAFAGDAIGHAVGTGGRVLLTTDDGLTWSSRGQGSTIRDFSFSGAENGVAMINDRVSLTSDGGAHWQPVDALTSDPKVKPFSQVESIAALSATRYAIALHQDQGENIMLSTVDAGKTWVPTHLENTFAGTLTTHDGEYWAFGIEYLGREHNPGGGYSAPVALHSQDGQNWQHGVRASTEFDNCNGQGCSLKYGVVEDLYGVTEKIWSLPQDSDMSGKWAMVGQTVCTVVEGLKCGSAIPSAAPQTMPDRGVIQVSLQTESFVEGCLRCEMPPIPSPPSLGGRPAAAKGILVAFTVGRDGTVSKVDVENMPDKELRDAIAKRISGWLVEPAHAAGLTVSSEKHIELGLMCFPKWPNSTTQPVCTVSPADAFARRR